MGVVQDGVGQGSDVHARVTLGTGLGADHDGVDQTADVDEDPTRRSGEDLLGDGHVGKLLPPGLEHRLQSVALAVLESREQPVRITSADAVRARRVLPAVDRVDPDVAQGSLGERELQPYSTVLALCSESSKPTTTVSTMIFPLVPVLSVLTPSDCIRRAGAVRAESPGRYRIRTGPSTQTGPTKLPADARCWDSPKTALP